MSHTQKRKIYYTMQAISVLPILLLGILILVFGSYSFNQAMAREIFAHLDTSAYLCISQLNSTYPGDYSLQEFTTNDQTFYALYKGKTDITNHQDFVDRFKHDTTIDVTLFYQDTRILTTILDRNKKRIIGTGAPAKIVREVQFSNEIQHYDNAMINGKKYYACYHPLTNSDGTVVGMLCVSKPIEFVKEIIAASLNPLILVGIIAFLIASLISFSYAKYFLSALDKLKHFFTKTATGNLNVKMDPGILNRNDEFSEIANAAVVMQKSLRNIMELDGLTTLFNRRTGEQRLQSTYLSSQDTKSPFCIVMADVDYFKSINDTYGHHNGDVILQNVSNLLKKHISPRGYAIRWGGEEFLLVLKNHTMEEALICLETLRQELITMPHTIDNNEVYVTMTFGVSCDADMNINQLIESADAKLYEGKEKGRNCIVS